MTTNQNPWATPGRDQDAGGPANQVRTTAPAAGAGQGEVSRLWDAYREAVTELARAQAAALQETATAAHEAQAAMAQARSEVDQARADRALVEERTGPFEAEVAQILSDARVSPDGAGSGSDQLPVQTAREALTVMDSLTHQLREARLELDQARHRRAAATARWIATTVVLAGAVVAAGALALLGAAWYVQAAGGVIAFCTAWPARARGWPATALAGGITVGVLVGIAALTGPVMSTIVLLAGALVAVILTARTGMVRATRVTPTTSGPTGPRQ